MKASIACSSSSSLRSSTFSHQKFYMIMNDLFVIFEKRKKQFKKNLNIIHKRMRFSMFNQTQIINYFKFVDQSFNSFKFNVFINSLCSTTRFCFSINRNVEISQSSKTSKTIKSFKSFKFDVFINCFNSTLRFYLLIKDKSITSQTINHIIDVLQILRVLLEQ